VLGSASKKRSKYTKLVKQVSHGNQDSISADDIEKITARLSSVDVTTKSASGYESAFKKIVCFVEQIRGQKIPSDELAVTRRSLSLSLLGDHLFC
jgi:hypothetical protein